MNTIINNQYVRHIGRERIRGHSQLQGKHEAFEEVFRQLWDLLWKDLTDEGDELVVLVAQGGELENNGGQDQHESTEHAIVTDPVQCPETRPFCVAFTLSRS